MAQISVGGAINEGFTIIRQEPVAVLLWGLTQLVVVIASFAVVTPFYMALFGAMQSGAGAQAFQAAAPQAMQLQAFSYVIDFLSAGVSAVIYCAVFRAVLHPERRQFGFMRVGAPELYVVLLFVGAYFALGLGLVAVIIVAAIIIGIMVALHAIWAAVIFGVAAVIASIGAMIYFALRFALVGPMIVEDGQFHLAESWALTRGHVGALFLIALVIFFILLLAEIVLGILLFALGLGAVTAIAGGLQNLPTLFQQPPQILLAKLGPLIVLAAVIWVPFIGCTAAVLGAPWARAYRDLRPPDVAATFA
jgi:hypothetical protein